LVLLLALYVLNLGYEFEGTLQKLGEYAFVSEALGGRREQSLKQSTVGNRFLNTWLAGVPVPLPSNYVQGIDVQKWDFERKMWSYLRGEWREGGWWYYYLYGLLIKAPLGTWILVLLAIGVGLFGQKYGAGWRQELVLLAPAVVVLTLVSSQTGFNHHVRYVLPALPFVFVWGSKVARAVPLGHQKVAYIATVALLWSIGSSLWIYPHSLSYFNELVGGPFGGHAHLGVSNIDWGQDLFYLTQWLDQHPNARPLGLAYDCPLVDPRILGIEYTLPPQGPDAERYAGPRLLGPQPGWYAVSVNRIRDRANQYSYFLRFEPVATAGYSIYIYHVRSDEANRVRRELGAPEIDVP
jgi:hypothetical protein